MVVSSPPLAATVVVVSSLSLLHAAAMSTSASTRTNIEDLKSIDVEKVMQQVRDRDLLVDLSDGVQVHCYLVHPMNRSLEYWKKLKALWTAYVQECGAQIVVYTIFDYRGN